MIGQKYDLGAIHCIVVLLWSELHLPPSISYSQTDGTEYDADDYTRDG